MGECGPIDSLEIIKDKLTGESKGFGFVRFAAAKHAKEAISKLDGTTFKHKTISLELARRKNPRPKTPGKYLGKSS